MKVGGGTKVPFCKITWPHQVSLGKKCQLENNIYFKYDGIWMDGPSIVIGDNVFIGAGCEFNISKGVSIGNHSNIASGCKFIDHDHQTSINLLTGQEIGKEQAIVIGKDVWLGFNTIVLKGVHIGDGAIVGAGAVVTKSISPYEIWAGVPAKKIGHRQ
jgi:acetyltransferase-like isoleucine patch superfamily enzyme